MMTATRFLIDTNIFILLEDTTHPVPPAHAQFCKKCSEKSIQLCLHPASRQDISRDSDILRKISSLSKLDKYASLNDTPPVGQKELENLYGPIKSPNDLVDCTLLYAIDKANAADFFITEDIKLRKRARQAGCETKILSITEALTWIDQNFGFHSVFIPQIREKECYMLPIIDNIYDSLEIDYPGFKNWLGKCRKEHRPCWVIEESDKIQALVILKEEIIQESPIIIQKMCPTKILKVCTFKIGEDIRGKKIGELFIKKLLWFATANNYSIVYLTTYEKQQELLLLLTTFGFEIIGKTETGENILCKQMNPTPGFSGSPLEFHISYYPHFQDEMSIQKFIVPIQAPYALRLFPEKSTEKQPLLFTDFHSAGNTIKKTYICHAKIQDLHPGDILLFYVSKNKKLIQSQELISIGIIESAEQINTFQTLMQRTFRRTVYTEEELKKFLDKGKTPLVLSFSLARHFKKSLNLPRLQSAGILKAPPQTIQRIQHGQYIKLLRLEETI